MSYVGLSGSQDINGILWGVKWDTLNLTYSTPTSSAEYTGYQQVNGLQAMNALQTSAIHRIMLNYSQVCGLNFALTTATGANIRFAEVNGIDSGVKDNFHNIDTAQGTPRTPVPPLSAKTRMPGATPGTIQPATTLPTSAASPIPPASCTRSGTRSGSSTAT